MNVKSFLKFFIKTRQEFLLRKPSQFGWQKHFSLDTYYYNIFNNENQVSCKIFLKNFSKVLYLKSFKYFKLSFHINLLYILIFF